MNNGLIDSKNLNAINNKCYYNYQTFLFSFKNFHKLKLIMLLKKRYNENSSIVLKIYLLDDESAFGN